MLIRLLLALTLLAGMAVVTEANVRVMLQTDAAAMPGAPVVQMPPSLPEVQVPHYLLPWWFVPRWSGTK